MYQDLYLYRQQKAILDRTHLKNHQIDFLVSIHTIFQYFIPFYLPKYQIATAGIDPDLFLSFSGYPQLVWNLPTPMDERQVEKLALDLKKLKIDTDFRSLRTLDFDTKVEVFSSLIQGTNPNSRLLELLADSAGLNFPSSRQQHDQFTKNDFQAAFYSILAEELRAGNYNAEQLMNSKKTCYSAMDYLIQRFQFKNVQKYRQLVDAKEDEARRLQDGQQGKKYQHVGGEVMEEQENQYSQLEESGRDSWIKAAQREEEQSQKRKQLAKAPAGVLPGVTGRDETGKQTRQGQQKTASQGFKTQNKQKLENPNSLFQLRAQIIENPADLNLQLMYQEELLIQYQAQIRQHQKQISQISAATVNMYQKLKNNTTLEGEQLKRAILEFQQAKEISINEYEQDIIELKQQLNQKTRIKNQHFFNDIYQLKKILTSGNKNEIQKQIELILKYYEQGDGNANLWADVYDVNNY